MTIENYEKGSIESIAMARWGEYSGDVKIMRDIEDQYPEFTLLEAVRRTLKENFVEGFRQGVLLRLTGDTDAHG